MAIRPITVLQPAVTTLGFSDIDMKSAATQHQEHLETILKPHESIDNLLILARLFWITVTPLPKDL